MGFTYQIYKELVKDIDYISKEIKKQKKDSYNSFKVDGCACELIIKANSLCAYIRHANKNKG